MLIDTHCHLDDAPLSDDLDAVLVRARGAGVGRVIVPGVRPVQWPVLRSMAQAHAEVVIATGLHPECLSGLSEGETDEACGSLREHALSFGAIAIGECGFDGGVAREGVSLQRQAAIVGTHARVADQLGLPLIVHVHDAMGFALAFFESLGPRRHGAVLHAFGGPADLVPRWVALGFSFGLGPSITWSRARRPKEAAAAIPLDRILLETDGPTTYVEGVATRVGEPAQLREVMRTLAGLRAIDESVLEAETTRNAVRCFGDRLGLPP